MAGQVPAYNLVATKVSSPVTGNAVQLLFVSPNGNVRFACTIANADFTSINTTVNGGAVGASLTFVYGQNVYPGANSGVSSVGDYPNGYTASEV